MTLQQEGYKVTCSDCGDIIGFSQDFQYPEITCTYCTRTRAMVKQFVFPEDEKRVHHEAVFSQKLQGQTNFLIAYDNFNYVLDILDKEEYTNHPKGAKNETTG